MPEMTVCRPRQPSLIPGTRPVGGFGQLLEQFALRLFLGCIGAWRQTLLESWLRPCVKGFLFGFGLGGGSLVFVDEPSESVAALDRPGCRSWRRVGCLKPTGAVGPLVVVVLDVVAQAVIAIVDHYGTRNIDAGGTGRTE